MMNDPALALSRFGLGAKPDQVQGMKADTQSLLKEALRDESAILEASGLQSTSDSIAAVKQFQAELRRRRAARAAGETTGREIKQVASPYQSIYLAEVEIGLLERLTLFWVNHFAISASTRQVRVMAGSFEREAIRPHITGRFGELLRSVISHPAMIVYLDNNRSVGPNSKVGLRSDRGLNENLARELLELHTLGVQGGYSQADVTEAAKVLTGWSFRINKAEQDPFSFRENQHEPGPKNILGARYEEGGLEEALALLDTLSRHPATARNIALKLARYFVADDPPVDLVEALERRFLDSDGDLLAVYETLLDHPESWSPAQKKLRTPQEWLVAASRAFEADIPGQFANRSLSVMGHRFWYPPSPKGYEDHADAWLGGALIKARIDWAGAFADRFMPAGEPMAVAEAVLGRLLTDETALELRRAATRKQAFGLLLLAPEMMRR